MIIRHVMASPNGRDKKGVYILREGVCMEEQYQAADVYKTIKRD